MCKTLDQLRLQLANAQHDYTFFDRPRGGTLAPEDKRLTIAALAQKTQVTGEIINHEKQCQQCKNEKLLPRLSTRNPKVGVVKTLDKRRPFLLSLDSTRQAADSTE